MFQVSSGYNIGPNFAEELAKRLGTVRQAQKPTVIEEKNEASINRFKGIYMNSLLFYTAI